MPADAVTDGTPWLVVGLGNPGPTYAGHRHNVGYLVTDELASPDGRAVHAPTSPAAPTSSRAGWAPWAGPGSCSSRPRSYMNESGGPVKALASFYKVPPGADRRGPRRARHPLRHAAGQARRRRQRPQRAAVDARLARHRDFHRVRVGIGRPPGRQDVADFVLSNYSTVERKELPFQVDRAADAVESLLTVGLEQTQQRFNS